MGIDDARQGDHAGAVDPLGIARLERRPDGHDRAVLDQDVGGREIAQRRVHGDGLGAGDDRSLGHGYCYSCKARPQPGRDIAGVAFEAGIHLVRPHAGRHGPAHDVGQAVLLDEGRELGDAVVDVAHDPGLRDALGLGDAGDAAVAAGLGAELVVDLHAPPLGDPHRRPVALAVVGDEAGADDADAMGGGIAPLLLELRQPRIERARPLALRQQVRAEARGPQRAGLRHRGDPQRRAARLHVARRDLHVLEIVALALEAELLAGEGALQHLDSLVGQRHAARDRHAEAAELVRRVAHADAHLDPAAADIVEHREILGEPDRMVERQQADIAREAHMLGPRRHRRGDGNPRRQVAVVDEVMLGEPDEIEAEPVEPSDLIHDRGIERLMGKAGLRRIAEVVGDAEAERFAGHGQSLSSGTSIQRRSATLR